MDMLSADLFQHWKPLFEGEEPSQEYLVLESQIPEATSRMPEVSLRLRSFYQGVSKLRSSIKNFLHVKADASVASSNLVESYLKAAARLEEKVNAGAMTRAGILAHSWLTHINAATYDHFGRQGRYSGRTASDLGTFSSTGTDTSLQGYASMQPFSMCYRAFRKASQSREKPRGSGS